MTDEQLVARAQELRDEHLRAHDITGALHWDQLQPSEQQMWLDRVRKRAS